jgi:hypothetical protein
VDLSAVATACGFVKSVLVTRMDQVEPLRKDVHATPGPWFAQVKVAADKLPLVLPPRDGTVLKNRFREALLGPSAHHQS